MTNVTIETGTLYAKTEDRIISGLLLPYGEQGKTNLGRFSIEPSSITIPNDPMVVGLNIQHDQEEPVGRATELLDTPAGIIGTFKVAETPEGDALLAEIAEGKRNKLSAEVKNVVIRAGKAVGGVLFGAAAVVEGAFPSAALMAELAEDTEPEEEDVEEETPEAPLEAQILDVVPDPEGNVEEIIVDDLPEQVIVDVVNPADGSVTQTVFVPETQPQTQGDNMGAATAPETLQAAKAAPASESLSTVVNQLASASKSGSRSLFAEIMKREDAKATTSLFAALSDVEFDSAGSAGINAQQPQWLGELWNGRAFERKFIPLISSGSLSAMTIQAWRWTTQPAVSAWTGNKSAVPSNVPATESYEVTAQRYAGAHDWAREFRDFGRTDVIESALRGMTESYARVTDAATLTALVAGATEVTAGAATEQIAWNYIIDGVNEILPVAVPTFAVVAQNLYRELLLTTNQNALAYLSATVGLESGNAAGFQIIPSASLADDTVLVGAREAATSYELAGSPIRVEATDMVNGGYDVGLFGYHAVSINNPGALAIVAPAA